MVSITGAGDLAAGTVKGVRERVRPKANVRRRVRTAPPQPVEVTVRLSSALVDDIRDMAKAHGISEAQALRDAVGTGLYIDRQRRLGRKVQLKLPGGQVQEVYQEANPLARK